MSTEAPIAGGSLITDDLLTEVRNGLFTEIRKSSDLAATRVLLRELIRCHQSPTALRSRYRSLMTTALEEAENWLQRAQADPEDPA